MRKYVTIRYSSRFGPDDQKILNLKAKQIQLRNHGVTSLDLSEIKDIAQLQRIDIACNQLTSLDLTSIAECENLRYFDLSENKLTEIDLSPIVKCKKLMRLDLSSNFLQEIDLTPLYHNTHLHTIYLQHNDIRRLNITPLIMLPELNQVNFEGLNPMIIEIGESVSKTRPSVYHVEPLLKTILENHRPTWLDMEKLENKIKTISYKQLVSTKGWNSVKERLRRMVASAGLSLNFELQKLLLNEFGMGELACYEGNLLNIIESIPEDKTYSEALKTLYLNVIAMLRSQLERDGSTLHFDIDKLADKQSSVLIPLLLEKRQKEMENTILKAKKNEINLSKLWKTGYGHEILSALGMKIIANRQEFKVIENAFSKVGITLTVQ